MAYNRETKQAAQQAYHEARAFGHTKEEARSIRDNWRNVGSSYSCDDEDWYEDYGDEDWDDDAPYIQDTIDD